MNKKEDIENKTYQISNLNYYKECDSEFAKLLSGDTTGFSSLKDYNVALYCKLISYKFEEYEKKEIMRITSSSWKNASRKYKELIIKKAEQEVNGYRKKRVEELEDLKLEDYETNVTSFYDIQPFFYDNSGMFWIYKNNKWDMIDSDLVMMNIFDETMQFDKQTYSIKVQNGYLNALKREGLQRQPKPLSSNIIQFKNCIYDLTNKKLLDSSPDYFTVNQIPHNFFFFILFKFITNAY